MPMTSRAFAAIISGDATLRTKEPFRILWPVHRRPCRAARFPGAPGWMKIEKMPCSRERFLPKRARMDALSSESQPLSSPSGQSPLKGTPRKLCHKDSLASPAFWPVHWHPCRALPPFEAARTSQSLPLHSDNRHSKEHRENFATGATSHSPALWPVHRCPCRALLPIEAARTSQSLPSPSGQLPLKGTSRKFCHKAASHPPALWPVHRHPCRALLPIEAARTSQSLSSPFGQSPPKGTPRKLCHRSNLASPAFWPALCGPVGRCPLSKHAPPRACRSHPGNRHSKAHRENFATGATSHSPALWPAHRRSCRALPPFRSGTHLPEPVAPNLTIAIHGTRGKLPRSVVRRFRVYQISGRFLQIFQAYL